MFQHLISNYSTRSFDFYATGGQITGYSSLKALGITLLPGTTGWQWQAPRIINLHSHKTGKVCHYRRQEPFDGVGHTYVVMKGSKNNCGNCTTLYIECNPYQPWK